jgi:hypothetical protein
VLILVICRNTGQIYVTFSCITISVLRAAPRYRSCSEWKHCLILYLGNRRASLILIVQIVSPCVSHTVSHASRMRLGCVLDAYHNRNAAHSQQSAKHRFDDLRELGAARFVNATAFHPEMPLTIADSLFSAEFYLLIARLVLTSAFHMVFKRVFLAVRSSSMRQHSVVRDMVIGMFQQTKVPVPDIFHETHRCADLWQSSKKRRRVEAGGHDWLLRGDPQYRRGWSMRRHRASPGAGCACRAKVHTWHYSKIRRHSAA